MYNIAGYAHIYQHGCGREREHGRVHVGESGDHVINLILSKAKTNFIVVVIGLAD